MKQSNIIRWEREEEIGIITISNGKENYIDTPDFIDLEQLKEWFSEEGLKGIIVRGLGRNFSAGADVKKLRDLAKNDRELASKMDYGKEILNFVEDLNIPVIAAINGVCFGGGLEIALACHMRISSKRALFAFPETNHGLIPGLGGTYRLTKLVGKKAYDLILDADMISADEAKNKGLVHYVSELKDAFGLAKDKLQSMVSERPIEVIHSVMSALKNAENMEREHALKLETELFCKLAVHIKNTD